MSTLYVPGHYSPQELYGLLARQIKSYHKYCHMGDNTSVSADVARELTESIQFTLALAGEGGSALSALERGQQILMQQLEEAWELYRLVESTEILSSQWRWNTMESLRRYLEQYDLLHFAHRIPVFLDYPLALPVPSELKSIQWTRFYLHCLWLENQILAAVPEPEEYPPDYWEAPENLCQLPLLRALGGAHKGIWTEAALTEAARRVCTDLELAGAAGEYAWTLLRRQIPGILGAKERFWAFQ